MLPAVHTSESVQVSAAGRQSAWLERTAADFVTTSLLAKSQRFTHYSRRLDNGGMDAVIPLGEFLASRGFCDRLCGRLGHIDAAWHEPRLYAGAAAGLPA